MSDYVRVNITVPRKLYQELQKRKDIKNWSFVCTQALLAALDSKGRTKYLMERIQTLERRITSALNVLVGDD